MLDMSLETIHLKEIFLVPTPTTEVKYRQRVLSAEISTTTGIHGS